MKKWVKCVCAVSMWGVLLLVARPSRAGEYHTGVYLICSDCHTMHYSQQHQYDGTPGAGMPPLGAAGPYKYLLRNDENALCKSCHDGQTFAPDVVGANTGTHVREAGALNEVGGTGDYAEWKGHTLGSTATAPGGTFANAEGLECVNCHHQHGHAGSNVTDVKGNAVTSAYRNLRAMSIGGVNKNVSYAKETNDLTKDVLLRSWTLGDIANNYKVDNVDLNEPVSTDSGIGTWCKGCHTNFHGKKGDTNMGGNGTGGTEWLRHPTADANIGAVGGGHSSLSRFGGRLNRVKVMSPTGDWGTQGAAWANPPTDLTPTCITCHKAHGNKNPFGLIYMAGLTAGGVTEEGDTEGTTGAGSGARRVCMQCHVQGGT